MSPRPPAGSLWAEFNRRTALTGETGKLLSAAAADRKNADRLLAENERLRRALRRFLEDKTARAFAEGMEVNGQWFDNCQANAQWLALQLDLPIAAGWHNAAAVRAAITRLVDRMIEDIEDGRVDAIP